MAQTGDPTGTGMGGSGQEAEGRIHQRAACARHLLDGARRRTRIRPTASSSSASTTPASSTGQYTVWGEVIEGMENVDKIKRGEPVRDPDSIKTMRVAADVA
jgi:cyclophilin family peptidyl-prolyl cis-trans isomerase